MPAPLGQSDEPKSLVQRLRLVLKPRPAVEIQMASVALHYIELEGQFTAAIIRTVWQGASELVKRLPDLGVVGKPVVGLGDLLTLGFKCGILSPQAGGQEPDKNACGQRPFGIHAAFLFVERGTVLSS
jgi:hypothetical protein